MSKVKLTRNQRRRRRERELGKWEVIDDGKHHIDASSIALKHFEEMMDPTAREIAEVKYQHLVADPKGAELVGVPMALGGVPPTSVKVRVTLARTMTASSTGQIAIAFYNCSGPPYEPITTGSNPEEQIWVAKSLGNTMPKLGLQSTGPDVYAYIPPIIIGGYYEGQGIPALGASSAPPLPNTNALTVPAPGLDLAGAAGRLVAQEVEIYPVGPLLTTQGLGYTVVLNETSSSALNGQFPSNAFDLQNVQKHSFPLANWDPDCVIRAVRCPMAQTDVNLLHTDYTQVSGAVPGSPSYNVAGEVWGCFMGTGLTSMQAFRVETTLVYEFVGSQYTFSTSNNSTSSKGLEIVSAIKENLPAGVYERPTLEAQKAGAVAHAMVDTHGPKHAAGFASFLSKAGGVIGDVAKEVLPAVLGMALTAGTEGMIPPQVGYGLGREAFSLTNKLSGVPPRSLGNTPMLLPAAPARPSQPSRVEVIDALTLPEPDTQTRSETKDGGVPPLPESPDNHPPGDPVKCAECSCTKCAASPH